MSPGQTHEEMITMLINREWKRSAYTYFDKMRGFTGALMFVVNGFPQNDQTTKTQVSTASVSIDYASHHTYEYYVISKDGQKLSSVDNLPHGYTVAGMIMEEFSNAASVAESA